MTSMTKPAPSKTDDAGGEAKGGGKKKLILVLALVLVAAGAGAYFFLFSGSGASAEPTPGAVLSLDPVPVNLAGGNYLKIGVALQLTAAAGEKVDGSKAQDLIISTYSGAKLTDVVGSRDALKAALQKKIIAAYTENGTEAVMGIYLTQYVTQ